MSTGERVRGYLVESYWPGIQEPTLADVERRLRAETAGLRGRGQRAPRYLGAILVPEDETVFCIFEGMEPDIRRVSERSGIPVERVIESVWFDNTDQERPE